MWVLSASWLHQVALACTRLPACVLAAVSIDMLHFLHSQGVRVALLPNVSMHAPITPVTAASRGVRQSSNELLMVAPTAFGFNEQAAQV